MYYTDHQFSVVPMLFVPHTQTTFVKELEVSLIHGQPTSINLLIVDVHTGERPSLHACMLKLEALEFKCLSHIYGFSLCVVIILLRIFKICFK